jgi:hypothetical protein
MIGLIWTCRGVSKRGIATKVRDLYTEYKVHFVGLQETMKNKYSDKFFRLIDPHQGFAWHWLPTIVKVEEKEFLLKVEVFDKNLRKNISLVMVYGPALEDRRDVFFS